jgi:hypothetical protein
MVRILLGTAAAMALAACASTPPTPADMILGKWTCTAEQDGMNVKATTTYMKDGTTSGVATVGVQAPGSAIELTADVVSTWGFASDGRLKETVTSMKVTSATMGDEAMAAPMIASMVQPMVDQMVVGQGSTSTVVFDGATMTSTDEDLNSVTTCKR